MSNLSPIQTPRCPSIESTRVVLRLVEEEEERLLWQNKCALYTIIIQSIDMIGLATETPIKTCNMSLAWEPPYNDIIIHINKVYMFTYNRGSNIQ